MELIGNVSTMLRVAEDYIQINYVRPGIDLDYHNNLNIFI